MKEVSRIETITNSPIITHLNESNNGSSTIRVYGKTEEFERKQYFLLDRNGACLLMIRAIQAWFNCFTTFIIVAFLVCAFAACIIFKDKMNTVLVSLTLTNLMDIQKETQNLFM